MSGPPNDEFDEHEAGAPESRHNIGLLIWTIAASAAVLVSFVLTVVWLMT